MHTRMMDFAYIHPAAPEKSDGNEMVHGTAVADRYTSDRFLGVSSLHLPGHTIAERGRGEKRKEERELNNSRKEFYVDTNRRSEGTLATKQNGNVAVEFMFWTPKYLM